MSVKYKDPDNTLDYPVDWAPWLLTDTILTSTWIVPTGITKVTDTKTDRTSTIWLSGGTAGTKYSLTNRVVTVGGRTADFTIKVKVRNR